MTYSNRVVVFGVVVSNAIGVWACSSSSNNAQSTTNNDGGLSDAASAADAGCALPSGYTTVVANGAIAPTYAHESLVVTDKDEPRIAFVSHTSDTVNALSFVAWDVASCAWRAPVQVDSVASYGVDETGTSPSAREVSLARDPSNGHLSIAYRRDVASGGTVIQKIYLAISKDDGATWTTEQVAAPTMTNGADYTDSPAIAVKNGKTFIAYFQADSSDASMPCGAAQCSEIHLASRSGESGTFSDAPIPFTADSAMHEATASTPAIDIDSTGAAGVVWISTSSDTAVGQLVDYYHSGAASSVRIRDSEGAMNANGAITFLFDGDKPRTAFGLAVSGDEDSNVWFASSDDGTTWTNDVEIPPDGPKELGGWLSLAENASGDFTLASDFESSSTSDTTQKCDGPNLSTSGDGTTWSTCGTGPYNADDTLGFAGDFVGVKYLSTGKRIVVFNYATTASSVTTSVAAGLVVWREP